MPAAPDQLGRTRWRHVGGFILAGSLAFVTDIAVLLLLTHLLGFSPFVARIVSISVAMVVSWAINRTLTFAANTAPSLAEFGRFASVAWSASAFSYAVFSAVLLLRPVTPEALAAGISAVAAMAVSYAGMRFAVFR
jgi:putative flippase GtrA